MVYFEVFYLFSYSKIEIFLKFKHFIQPRDLGVTPWIKNWFNTLPEDFPDEGIECLNELIEFSLEPGLN